jgi:hypothetical protein
LNESLIDSNVTGTNYAIAVNGQNVNIVNSTISNNSGAGIRVTPGTPTDTLSIINSTITGHTTGLSNSGSLSLLNTIVANNSVVDCFGTITSNGYNIDSDDSCGLSGTGDIPNANPLLGPLQDNGGPTLTYALLSGSPAIDAGNDVGAPTADQRGWDRPQDGDNDSIDVTDIGAYELCSMTFNDVQAGSFVEPYIQALACRGVTGGCGADVYCPSNPVTRAQMAVFIIRSLEEDPSNILYNAFFDDVPDNIFATFINRMSELGITGGCGTRVYCPNNSINRAQMAVFIIRAIDETPSAAAFDAYFDDIPDNFFAPYINRMSEIGVTGGCGTRVYCPNSSVTRAQMAVFLVRAFSL